MISQQLFCIQIMKSSAKNPCFVFADFWRTDDSSTGDSCIEKTSYTEKNVILQGPTTVMLASELFSWSEQLRGFFELPWPFHRRFLWKITEKRMNSSSSIKRRRIITISVIPKCFVKIGFSKPKHNRKTIILHVTRHQVGVPHYPNLQKTTAWPELYTLKLNFEVESNT